MRLRVFSDLHLEFRPFEPPPVDADVVALAGDVHTGVSGVEWAAKAFAGTPVLYVLGNHEFYRQSIPKLIGEVRETAAGTNVHLLENDAITLHGVRFLGCTLWTDFELFGHARLFGSDAEESMDDYRLIRVSPEHRRLRVTDTIERHQQSRLWLAEQLGAAEGSPAVVITHHAPSRRSVALRFARSPLSPAFASPMDEFVKNSRAALWIHGHTHDHFDYVVGTTRVICNPRGYPGERTGFNPTMTVDVEAE